MVRKFRRKRKVTRVFIATTTTTTKIFKLAKGQTCKEES